MGYFPNGTAQEIYESQYCDHCRHMNPDANGCRATFAWSPGEPAGEKLTAALMQAVESALKANGE